MNQTSPADAANPGPVVLLIRDGWGRNPHPDQRAFDAIRLAETPVADRLESEWPTTSFLGTLVAPSTIIAIPSLLPRLGPRPTIMRPSHDMEHPILA